MDDFERELREMLNDRVAAMPEAFDAPPVLLRRARRRRTTRLTALAASVVVVIGGAAGAIAQVARGDGPRRVSTSTPTTALRPSVPTVICEADRVDNILGTRVLPPDAPRVPTAGDPAQLSKLASFAAADVPWLIALGPASWSCHWPLDGGTIVIFDGTATSGRVPTVDEAPIAVDSGALVDDRQGARLACSVFDDPAVMEHVNRNDVGDCVHDRTPSRTVTRVDEHVATFVDSDGSRGVGWMLLPPSGSAPSGYASVLTCRPTAGLTADECDTIIADFIARNDAEYAPPTTTTATPSTTTTSLPARVATAACPISYAVVGQTVEAPSTDPRVPAAGDSALFSHLASFAVTDDPRFVALGPAAWSCQGLMAADGDNGMVVYKTLTTSGAVPDVFSAPIAIENGYLWHGGVGSGTACSVFDDPAVVQYMTANFPQELPCPRAGRTVTRIDSHASTFVDADGARGVGWIMLPSSQAADDGRISVLTCRPTDGLTTADCDTVIADWVARNRTTG
jgi:hypothetical protein